MSTAFHPQSDGQTERTNRTLEDVLRHYVSWEGTDWSEHLDAAEYAINTAWQESIKETPFFLNYGRHPNSVVGLAARLAQPERSPSAKAFVTAMQEALAVAKDCLRKAQDRQKAYADQGRTDAWTPAVGDKVLLHTKNIRLVGCKKLLPTWLGPFVVKAAVQPHCEGRAEQDRPKPVAFKLELPASMGKMHDVFHVGMLKPWVEGSALSQRAVKPPPLMVDRKGEIFEVERILDHRDAKVASSKAKGKSKAKTRTQRQYLIKWLGYDDAVADTWEPEANIVGGAKSLLAEYWAARADGRDPAAGLVRKSRPSSG
jgi:hypothetical protein